MAALSAIEILGAGPAGLYAAILFKRAMPRARARARAESARRHVRLWRRLLRARSTSWPRTTARRTGFSAIGRLALLQLLQGHARSLGVELRFGESIAAIGDLHADLIVGADGVHSVVRTANLLEFAPQLEWFGNRFAWFGTPRRFETLTQTFVCTEHGALNAHHYRYSGEMSTFIVEVDPATFAAAGLDAMTEQRSAQARAELFSDALQGAPLLTNQSLWRRFPLLWCERWVTGNIALVGDAAHTAHYSVGSGTRLAMEDAIALVKAVAEHGDLTDGLAAYQHRRPPIARKIVDAAKTSAKWYEGYPGKTALAPYPFALDYIMRSGRIDMARLQQLSPLFVARTKSPPGASRPTRDERGTPTPWTRSGMRRSRRRTAPPHVTDCAVLDAYGWTDLAVPPFCPKTPDEERALEEFQDTIIDRLFVLNAERAEGEKRLGAAKPGRKPPRSRSTAPRAKKAPGQGRLFGGDE
jgi:2-polyprenyl-6-methoxyphenol hydroxylase-like FAD-dependent oxidoreductase